MFFVMKLFYTDISGEKILLFLTFIAFANSIPLSFSGFGFRELATTIFFLNPNINPNLNSNLNPKMQL